MKLYATLLVCSFFNRGEFVIKLSKGSPPKKSLAYRMKSTQLHVISLLSRLRLSRFRSL